MKKIKVGFLPLYIKLYDDSGSDRTYMQAFYDRMAGILSVQGFDVIKTDFCRIKEEFKAAVEKFENAGADVIVTLHAAYSPSLESIDALAKTKLPIVVLDSTEAFSLNSCETPGAIMNNHGIHGVMDMCNLLKQRGKAYAIAAGHTSNSNVIKKTCDFIKAAVSAKSLKGSKVGAFGSSFDGMGDFLISKEDAMDIFGIEIVQFTNKEMATLCDSVTDEEIAKEKEGYLKEFANADLDFDMYYKAAVRAGLAVRKGVEQKDLSAFSINFLDVSDDNLKTMPFIECSKAMAKGVGYAGEGDVLTAAFVGALLKGFKDTSFVEIFCPDWKKDKLLISHMGEMNYGVAENKPEFRIEKFIYSKIGKTAKAYACFKKGQAVFGNLFKDGDGKYKLLLSEVEMLDDEVGYDDTIRGWFRPNRPINEFLELLSEYGAIHHSFLVYDVDIKALEFFGKLLNLEVIKI